MNKQNIIPFEKQIAPILFFGVLWGLIELFVGGWVRSVQRELVGFVMPFLITVFIVFTKSFAPARGSVFLMAVIAAVIVLFLGSMTLHGAFTAILAEAVIAEIVFLIFGFKILTFIIIGILLQSYSLFHPYLTRGMFCQSSHFLFFKRLLADVISAKSTNELSVNFVTSVLLSSHFIAGLCAGITARIVSVFSQKIFLGNKLSQSSILLFKD